MAVDRFVGEIMMVPYGIPRLPDGVLLCSGQVLPIVEYANLYAIIGTTYGGDGQTTFALPNLTGSTVLGVGQGSGLSNRSLGGPGGTENTYLTTVNIPSHSHTFSAAPMSLPVGDAATSASPAGGYFGEMATGNGYSAPFSTATDGIEVTNTLQLSPAVGGQVPVNNMQPSLAINFTISFQGAATASDPYVGEIRMYAGSTAPDNWAFCQGQLLNISENQTLFALLGTTYGGDGQRTFGLPNLQGRAPVHAGTLSNRTFTLGETGGNESIALNIAQMPPHTHAITGGASIAAYGENPGTQLSSANNHPAFNPSLVRYSSTQKNPVAKTAGLSVVANGVSKPTLDVGFTGGSQPFSTMQPYMPMNFIISLYGIFPSRN